MIDRRVSAFFYGLFMDIDLLQEKGISVLNPQRAYVDGYALRIGNRATLIPSSGGRSYGMLMALTHDELNRLYSAPGLEQYRPEAVLVQTLNGDFIPALCYNLLEAPAPDERNPDYATKLQAVLRQLDFPAEYIDAIS
jgi:hypothetical protein